GGGSRPGRRTGGIAGWTGRGAAVGRRAARRSPALAGRRPPPCGRPTSRFSCEQLPEGVNLQIPLGQEPLESGVLLLKVSLPPQFWDPHAAVAASPAGEGVHGDAVVAAELPDGLLADVG